VNPEILYSLGIAFVFIGIVVLLLAFLLLFFSGIKNGEKIRGGGAIIIGPIPIISGTDKNSLKVLLLLSIILTILLIALMIVFHFVLR
jgi:uncharacterized protein (TIGR00304 family)